VQYALHFAAHDCADAGAKNADDAAKTMNELKAITNRRIRFPHLCSAQGIGCFRTGKGRPIKTLATRDGV